MSTNGCIARAKGDGFEGTYHHWDSYPTGLGKNLWGLYHGHFRGDLKSMLKVLIDDHPAGWSTLVKKDWRLSPGFCELPARSERPQCYCHGDRHEEPCLFNEKSQAGLSWAYVFDEGSRQMSVLRKHDMKWVIAAIVLLDGPAPNWSVIECGPHVEYCCHYRCLHGAPGCKPDCYYCHGTGKAPPQQREGFHQVT